MNKELKLVPCGCGGEAFVSLNGFLEYHAVCALCGMRTDWFRSKDKAIEAWNRAMGSAEKSSTVERTAKAEYSNADGEYLCSECGRVVQIEDAYCCGCGARLEWDE